jgi:hypothetical protein
MDPASNLTTVWEFNNNYTLRLVSYIDPDVVLGGFPPDADSQGYRCARVYRLSSGIDPKYSLLWAWCPQPAYPYWIFIGPNDDHDQALSWSTNANDMMLLASIRYPPSPTPDFTMRPDFLVDGQCWFALNDSWLNHVADISESGTAQGNPIIKFTWNNGTNQIWRAERQ